MRVRAKSMLARRRALREVGRTVRAGAAEFLRRAAEDWAIESVDRGIVGVHRLVAH